MPAARSRPPRLRCERHGTACRRSVTAPPPPRLSSRRRRATATTPDPTPRRLDERSRRLREKTPRTSNTRHRTRPNPRRSPRNARRSSTVSRRAKRRRPPRWSWARWRASAWTNWNATRREESPRFPDSSRRTSACERLTTTRVRRTRRPARDAGTSNRSSSSR